MSFTTIQVEQDGKVRRIRLNRPDVHNAFNGSVVEELTRAFREAGDDRATRVVVLSGNGPSFSAGADLAWMREQARLPAGQGEASARVMGEMFLAIARCPKAVVGRIHGAALGGGSGLTCAVDIAVAAEDTKLGFTEAKLGIIPAVISPFAVERIGISRARELFLTARRFDGREAERLGVVHRAVPPADLDGAVASVVADLLTSGPLAIAECKALLRGIHGRSFEEAAPLTAATIARIRATPEAEEGMSAFLEKRRPAW